MNSSDEKLREALRLAASVPPPQLGARDRAHHRALVALRQPSAQRGRDEESPALFRFFALIAAACGMLAILVAVLLFGSGTHAEPDPSASAALLNEMEETFPGQLKAVVRNGSDLAVQLSNDAAPVEPVASQGVSVTLSNAREKAEVLTYSGREVCVQMGAREICFTPLIDGKGNAFIVTAEGISTPRQSLRVGEFALAVRRLPGGPL